MNISSLLKQSQGTKCNLKSQKNPISLVYLLNELKLKPCIRSHDVRYERKVLYSMFSVWFCSVIAYKTMAWSKYFYKPSICPQQWTEINQRRSQDETQSQLALFTHIQYPSSHTVCWNATDKNIQTCSLIFNVWWIKATQASENVSKRTWTSGYWTVDLIGMLVMKTYIINHNFIVEKMFRELFNKLCVSVRSKSTQILKINKYFC